MTVQDPDIQRHLSSLKSALETLRTWKSVEAMTEDGILGLRETQKQITDDSSLSDEYHGYTPTIRDIEVAKEKAAPHFKEADYDINVIMSKAEDLLRHDDDWVNERAIKPITHLDALASNPLPGKGLSEQRDDLVLDIQLAHEKMQPNEEMAHNKGGYEGKPPTPTDEHLTRLSKDLLSLKSLDGFDADYDPKRIEIKVRNIMSKGNINDQVEAVRIMGELRKLADSPFISHDPIGMRDRAMRRLEMLHTRLKK